MIMQTTNQEARDEVVCRTEEVISAYSHAESHLYDEYKKLAADYSRLLHRLDKIIAISDKYQIDLKETSLKLNSALEHVNELKKIILPICMYCKKIRTDGNYWQQVEHYFHQHIDVMFSHGICPECLHEKRMAIHRKDPI